MESFSFLLQEKFREETCSVPTKEHMKVAEEEEQREERSLEVSTWVRITQSNTSFGARRR